MPYVFHPFYLAEQMKDENTTIVALLHDIVEDTDYAISDLTAMGFSKEVTDAINLMTHKKNVPYMDYVKSIGENEIAKVVKIADLKHNSDLTRLDSVSEYDVERIEKYKVAISILNE